MTAAGAGLHGEGDDPAPVLDIGVGVGAALVRLSRRPATGELWACPRGAPRHRFHTGVHRQGAGWFGLFADLPAGDYSLLDDDDEHTPFSVTSGAVTEVTTPQHSR